MRYPDMQRFFLRHFIRARRLIRDQWRAGMRPHPFALACAVSLFIGTMPMLGPVTALSLLSSWLLRLSVPMVMGLTVLMTPIQAVLAIPLQQLGARWFPIDAGRGLRASGMVTWLETAGAWQIQALEAWLVVMLPAATMAYLLIYTLLKTRQRAA